MADNLHPLTELLLARMESHPEEFRTGMGEEYYDGSNNRWRTAISAVIDCGSDEDKKALNAAHNAIVMQEAHEWALDELMNGDERRRVNEEMRQAWKTTHPQGFTTLAAQQTSQALAQQQYMNQAYTSSIGLGGNGASQSLSGLLQDYNNHIPTQSLYQKVMKALGR